MAETFRTDLTSEEREVLNLIAQGDETIVRIAPGTVKTLRWNGFIVLTSDGYELTSKGNDLLGRKV